MAQNDDFFEIKCPMKKRAIGPCLEPKKDNSFACTIACIFIVVIVFLTALMIGK